MAASSATTSIRLVADADETLLLHFLLIVWDLIGDEGADETAIV